MVGKLNLDLGDDYAFDIRRAREVAEGAGGGGAEKAEFGPFQTSDTKTPYWLRAFLIPSGIYPGKPLPGSWDIGFDLVKPFDPDLWVPIDVIMGNEDISDEDKESIGNQIDALS